MKRIASLLLFVAFVALGAQAQEVKNIIFLIGDGMGLNQMYVGMTANHNRLNIEQCSYVGLSKTYSADRYITDSAAGGTALATGVKTKNGMIGMSPDSVAVTSSMAMAKKQGMRTGLVVTSPVTHATPASFYAHQTNRHMYDEIAVDLLNSDIDLAIGGGRNHFEKRKDKANVSKALIKTGYQVVYTEKELQQVKSGKVVALLDTVDMPIASKRGNMLPESAAKALELLSQNNEKGFFLMIEGSQIDYQGHNNNAEEMAREMIDFDRTIGIALDFARKHPGTLVVITADHETGGATIMNGDFTKGTVEVKYNTDGHTGTIVPVYSFGPGAEAFTGIQENTDIAKKIMQALQRR